MNDRRDPLCVGHKLLSIAEAVRKQRPISLSAVADANGLHCPAWTGNGLMSNDPAKHHSKTPQDFSVGTRSGSPSSQGFSE